MDVRGLRDLQVTVDVLETVALGDHHDLGVVKQLADLLAGGLIGLVLTGHPGLGSLLHELLADEVDPAVQFLHGPGALGAGGCLVLQLIEKVLKGLHGPRLSESR